MAHPSQQGPSALDVELHDLYKFTLDEAAGILTDEAKWWEAEWQAVKRARLEKGQPVQSRTPIGKPIRYDGIHSHPHKHSNSNRRTTPTPHTSADDDDITGSSGHPAIKTSPRREYRGPPAWTTERIARVEAFARGIFHEQVARERARLDEEAEDEGCRTEALLRESLENQRRLESQWRADSVRREQEQSQCQLDSEANAREWDRLKAELDAMNLRLRGGKEEG